MLSSRLQASKSTVFDVPASRAWELLAYDFDKIATWAAGVTHSVSIPKGTVSAPSSTISGACNMAGRVCTVTGLGNIEEVFTRYSDEGMSYAYEASGMPFFIRRATNSIAISPSSSSPASSCVVTLGLDMEFVPVLGWILRWPFARKIDRLLVNTLDECK